MGKFSLFTSFILFMFMIAISCTEKKIPGIFKVKPGIDVLMTKNLDLINGKKIGLITNATGITNDFRSTIDVLYNEPTVELIALFGPEHGVRGDIEGGHIVPQYVDPQTGVPVYSLYGKVRKPTPDMLKTIDVLIYDIQDIGSRAYTYIYTMALSMEAAKEADIPFIVLDRPNPLSGDRVEGNVLDPEFKSFIGLYPIPYIYGMTVGELAQLFNNEFGIQCSLTVIPMEGWKRRMLFEDTGLPWVPTSPHVPHALTSFFVAATGCIGELGTVSEGVGYTSPFELIGAPWIDGNELAAELNSNNLPGVHFRPISYKPFYMKYANEQCSGVQIHITNIHSFTPSQVQIHILTALKKLYPGHDIFESTRTAMFDKAFGSDDVRQQILTGTLPEIIITSWQEELANFLQVRSKYLIYE